MRRGWLDMHVVVRQSVFDAHVYTHTYAQCIAGSQDETDFRFSLSQLPPWAQKQMLSRPSVACKVESGGGRVPPPSVSSPARVYGRWAEVSKQCTPRVTLSWTCVLQCVCRAVLPLGFIIT